MARKRFYEIDKASYLLAKGSPSNADRDQPEECVRQWCAFELLSAYGIRITNIEFERPVRVGSKHYRIDILVARDGVPAVVVECKPRDFSKHAEGMAQAVSYADARNIRAEFAVYTNGDAWHVKRRFRDRWVSVTDLPQQVDRNGTEPIAELLVALDVLSPLLCKLGEPLIAKDAWHFIAAMQKFFYGTNLLTEDIDGELCFAMDNLLRCLWAADDDCYRCGKFRTAGSSLEKYRKRADVGLEIVLGNDSLWAEMKYLHAALRSIVDFTTGVAQVDLLVLRLATGLVDYGRQLRDIKKPQSYPSLGPSVHDPLRDYLSYALAVHLNISLPDPLDKIWIADIRGYCLPAWKALTEEE